MPLLISSADNESLLTFIISWDIIIYLIDGRSLPRHKQRLWIYSAGVLMEHFLDGSASF